MPTMEGQYATHYIWQGGNADNDGNHKQYNTTISERNWAKKAKHRKIETNPSNNRKHSTKLHRKMKISKTHTTLKNN